VTAAGFLPIGFANSAVGEYAGGIFWIVAIALVASWFVAVIFTPYIGVMMLPNIKVHANHDPHAVYETRMYRGLRAVIQWCVKHRVKTVLATVGIFVLSIVGFGHIQQQFFRSPNGPNCSCSCGCPRARPSTSPKSPWRRPRRCSRTTRTSRPTPPMSARARRASGSA